MGHGQGHLTPCSNFGSLCLCVELVKPGTLNLVHCHSQRITDTQEGLGLGHLTPFFNYETLYHLLGT